MKKILLTTIFISTIIGGALAQYTPTDWTLTAEAQSTGDTYNLFDILNSGKAVYLDFFQPDCGPCKSWHDYHTFEDFYQLHGPDGDITAMVFMINTFDWTNWTNITGANNLNFDWSQGVSYPIITVPTALKNQILSDYNAWGTPIIWKICPDKKMERIWNLHGAVFGQVSDEGSVEGLEEWLTDTCGVIPNTTSVKELSNSKEINIYPNPANNIVGITSYSLISNYKIINGLGQVVLSQNNVNQYRATINTSSLDAGIFFVQIESSNGIEVKKLQIIK